MKLILPACLALTASLCAQPAYDLLLKGGHVIDPKNKISQVMDVAVAGGKIARVEMFFDREVALRAAGAGGSG